MRNLVLVGDAGLYIGGGGLNLRCRFQNAGLLVLKLVDVGVAADGQWHTAGSTYDGAGATDLF